MANLKHFSTKMLVGLILLIVIGSVLYTLISTNKFDYQKFFNQNQEDLTNYVRQFNNQSSIVSINRNDSLIFGLSYSLRRNYSYDKSNNATFSVLRKYLKSEEEFWGHNSEQIVSSKGTGEINLENYLKLCNMTKTELTTWRQFLKNYNFPYIMKDKSNQLVTIGLNNKTGFIYRSKTNVDLGYAKIIKLNDNWFYFDEKIK